MFLNMFKTLKFIIKHPLNKDNKIKSIINFFRWQLGSRILKKPVIINFVNRSRLIVEKGMTGATGNIYTGLHEFEDMSFVLHLLRKDEVMLDIGANIGDSIAACLKRDTDIFLAIEPHPTFNKYLHKNFGKCSNVKIMEVVCSSSSKTETYQIDEKSGTASVISNRSGRVIQTKTIDEIIEEKICSQLL